MSKITLEAAAQIIEESIDDLILHDALYEDKAETLHRLAALLRAAQKVINQTVAPFVVGYYKCAMCSWIWKGTAETHHPGCSVGEFRKEEGE